MSYISRDTQFFFLRFQAFQADASFSGTQDPHPHVPSECKGAVPARLLSRPGHRHLRLARLLRGASAGESQERLHEHPGGSLVGPGHHDDRGLRRHGAEDLRGDAGRCPVRTGRRADHSAARSRHCLKLHYVLLAHAGPREAAQAEKAGPARRTGPGQAPEAHGPRWNGAPEDERHQTSSSGRTEALR